MKAIDLFLLAAMIDMELILGIVVAPVIFYSANLIGEGALNHFQSGLMMAQTFIKTGCLLIFVSITNLLFEIYPFAEEDIEFQTRFSKSMLVTFVLISSLVLVLYFTNTTIELQSLDEQTTKSQGFPNMHNASETVIKIVLSIQAFLYFLNFRIAKKCQNPIKIYKEE